MKQQLKRIQHSPGPEEKPKEGVKIENDDMVT